MRIDLRVRYSRGTHCPCGRGRQGAHYGFALGAHGLDAVRYAELLEARWLELVGIA